MSPPPTVQVAFQGYLDRANAASPPSFEAPWTSGIFRHACTGARYPGRSEPLTLHERYVTLAQAHDELSPTDPEIVAFSGLAGYGDAFALIYREGRCARCGKVARSASGRVVRTDERPPLAGRVAR